MHELVTPYPKASLLKSSYPTKILYLVYYLVYDIKSDQLYLVQNIWLTITVFEIGVTYVAFFTKSIFLKLFFHVTILDFTFSGTKYATNFRSFTSGQ